MKVVPSLNSRRGVAGGAQWMMKQSTQSILTGGGDGIDVTIQLDQLHSQFGVAGGTGAMQGGTI